MKFSYNKIIIFTLVREKVKELIELITDEQKLESERENAKKIREKMQGFAIIRIILISLIFLFLFFPQITNIEKPLEEENLAVVKTLMDLQAVAIHQNMKDMVLVLVMIINDNIF